MLHKILKALLVHVQGKVLLNNTMFLDLKALKA